MLPVLELAVAGIVAGPSAVGMMHQPPHLLRAANGKIVVNMKDPAAARWLREPGPRFPSRFQDVYFLNIPGMLIEIVVSLPTTWPDSYRPSWAWPIGLDGFRALTWPIWALPFWFVSGRGLDSLLNRVHISAFEAFLMGLLSSLILIAVIGIASCARPDPEERYIEWAILPCLLWIGFGLVCQIAWWRQRRGHRNIGQEAEQA